MSSSFELDGSREFDKLNNVLGVMKLQPFNSENKAIGMRVLNSISERLNENDEYQVLYGKGGIFLIFKEMLEACSLEINPFSYKVLECINSLCRSNIPPFQICLENITILYECGFVSGKKLFTFGHAILLISFFFVINWFSFT
jgi:hypothetical protein